jgi:hypothetical protein
MQLDYGYVLKITNFTQLLNYTMDYSVNIFSDPFFDYAETITQRNNTNLNTHFKNNLNACIENLLKLKTNSTYIKELSDLSGGYYSGQVEMLGKYGCIYVQYTGGYFCKSDDIIEYGEPIYSEKCVFPTKKEIKVFKWPNGKHWYAKIGSADVVIDGEQKWNSYDTAKEKAELFLENL